MGELKVKPIHNVFKQYKKVNLVNPYWFQKPFESTWRTSSISTGSSTAMQVKLPLISTGTYNFVVNWGDGTSDTITAWNQAQTTHTYSASGDYTIKITGTCNGWQFNNTGDRLKIRSIASWGKLRLGVNEGNYFLGCSNLNLTLVSDILDLTNCVSLANCFNGISSAYINRITEWDTSNILDMSGMFASNPNYNQNLTNLNVSKVLNFTSMFNACSIFNNGLASGVVGTMHWNISTTAPITMNLMFNNAFAFNQNITTWVMTRVTTIQQMFRNATKFNQAIGVWDTQNITNMSAVFYRDTTGINDFNQDLGNWIVVKVTTFSLMFGNVGGSGSVFNNGGSSTIGNWVLNTTTPVTISGMFNGARSFNQNINWNTIRVTDMSGTFQNAIVFNNGLASGVVGNMSLNTSSVLNMSAMLNGATAFNQNIGDWNISLVTNFTLFMAAKTPATYSATNLDAIYNGWSSLVGGVKPNIVITFGTAKYTVAGSAGRAILTGAPNLWTITDGGI